MRHNLCELEETTQECDRQTRVQFHFLWQECTPNHLSACVHTCAHMCVCMWVYFFFVGGWGMWKERQNILQSTDMNNNSVYKFQSPSSQFKTLFPAHFASSCTSLYVILSNFRNCYKILWKLITVVGGGDIWRNEPLHHAFISYTIYKKWVKIILR